MIQELDRWGVKFEKDETGDYAVRKVHHLGTYVLPMPEGHDLKKILYRQLKRARVADHQPLHGHAPAHGRRRPRRRRHGLRLAARPSSYVIRAKAVILCCGAAGRLGLPASGYLFGTYENPTNAGDGYAMAYHAGAELANLECFQINPLIKDYNGPACAYVTGPFGGYTANAEGQRFIECDYWSGQMMLEFYNELQCGKGPVFLKLDHLRRGDDRRDREHPAHATSGPAAAASTSGAAPTTASSMVEMHISEIGFCSGPQRLGRVGQRARARPRCPASTRPATWRACRTTTCWAPSSTAGSPARHAADYCAEVDLRRASTPAQVAAEQRARARAAAARRTGIPPHQIEYKPRRLVNDYLQPPKVTRKMRDRPGALRRDRARTSAIACRAATRTS